MSAVHQAIPPNLARGMSRTTAASYLNISVGKFDEMVKDGRMPPAKRIDGRKVWDRLALDAAFDALPDDDNNPWNEVLT